MRPEPPRRRPASLALRVTALVGLAMTLVFLTFNWGVVRSLERHFAEQDAQQLDGLVLALADTLRRRAGEGQETLRQQLARAVTGRDGIVYGVYDDRARLVHATPGPRLSALLAMPAVTGRIRAEDLKVWRQGEASYRAVTVRVPIDAAQAPEHRIVAILDIGFHLDFLAAFRRMLWWSTGLVLCVALAVAWLAVQWGHRPIRKVGDEIRMIRSSRLEVRLDPREVPIELETLVVAFNDMLARIEEGFARLSHFSADIAHELRTPVTSLITQAHVALGQPRSADAYREILYSNLEEFDRMSRMIGDMLFLAQTENDPGNLRLGDIDPAGLVSDLFDYFEALAEDRGIALCSVGAVVPIRADREMLVRALGNLLSNAIRHTPDGAAITVRLKQDERWTTITVENPGKKIPEADLPRLFDRFFQVDPARPRTGAGAGLGLAIVKSIAEAHGGRVRAVSSEDATRFDLVLPRVVPAGIELALPIAPGTCCTSSPPGTR